jgi:hypothetical protein
LGVHRESGFDGSASAASSGFGSADGKEVADASSASCQGGEDDADGTTIENLQAAAQQTLTSIGHKVQQLPEQIQSGAATAASSIAAGTQSLLQSTRDSLTNTFYSSGPAAPPLRTHKALCRAAELHAGRMSEAVAPFSHENALNRINEAGRFEGCGENLARLENYDLVDNPQPPHRTTLHSSTTLDFSLRFAPAQNRPFRGGS